MRGDNPTPNPCPIKREGLPCGVFPNTALNSYLRSWLAFALTTLSPFFDAVALSIGDLVLDGRRQVHYNSPVANVLGKWMMNQG